MRPWLTLRQLSPGFPVALSCVAFGLSALGSAQLIPIPRLGGFKPPASQPAKNPLEPSSFPNPQGRSGTLPAPDPSEDKRDFRVLESGTWRTKDGITTIEGGAHAVYRGYDLFGDRLVFDRSTQMVILTGNARAIGKDAVVQGDRVTVFFETDSFRAEDGEAIIRPSARPDRLLDDVYLKGGTTYGTEREVFGENCALTTCDKDSPHFHLDADRVVARVGKRAILRDVRLKVLDRTIFGLPYLSIPLERRSERYLPEVGQSQDEGYFAKFNFPIPVKDDRTELISKVDLMSKLGVGLGALYNYEARNLTGSARFYTLTGSTRSTEITNQHQQRFGNLTVSLANNYQRQNYLNAPENTFLNTLLGLTFAQKTGTTSVGFNRYQNDGEGFTSRQQTITLSDSRNFGSLRTRLDLNYTNNSSSFTGGQSTRENLDVNFLATHTMRAADAEFEYRRAVPIGETQNFLGAADRTPVLSLKSDSSRLLGNKWSDRWPIQAEFSLGEFSNPATRDRVGRGYLDLGLQRSDDGRSRFGMSLDTRYRQGVYSDDTAQYGLGVNWAGRWSIAEDALFNVRYSFLRQYGFTPLDFDQQGRYNFASMDLSFSPLRNVKLGAQSGYDFELARLQQTAWQTLGVRSEWTPTKNITMRGLYTYDPFSKAWSNLRFDATAKVGGAYLAAGARYDGIRHTWGNLNFYLDGLQMGRLRFSTLLVYNGYIRQFEARHFNFIYDLHCAEAVLQVLDTPVGFRPGRTISLFIRLKAMPWDTGFGLGRQGQSFGVGTGRDGF